MNRLKVDKRKAVVAALVEGASVNSTVRMTGVSKPTILKLLRDLGCACAAFHDRTVRGLRPKSIQCDEVWSFIGCKQKNVPQESQGVLGRGDCWTWTALDRDTKVMITWLVGLRTPQAARAFMLDLARRVVNGSQVTTDGFGAYPEAIREAFGSEVDYAMLVKKFAAGPPTDARYSPARCTGCEKKWVAGFPDSDLISTSHVERSTLTIRMQMRRFTRLTNGFSKKIDNHGHALSVFFVYYNFCRIHMTLRITPAMAAGLSDHVWELDELIGLLK